MGLYRDRAGVELPDASPSGVPASAGTSIMHNAGSFIPPSTGTFPGFDLIGLAFDKAAEEKAAIALSAPADWPSVDVYLWLTSELAGNAKFHSGLFGEQDSVTFAMAGSFGLTRARLVQGAPFAPSTAVTGGVSGGPQICSGPIFRDVGDTPSGTVVGRSAPASNVDGDVVVLFLELVRGA